MKSLSVKLLVSESGHGTVSRVVDAFLEMLETGPKYSIEYHPQLHKDDIKAALIGACGDNIECRDGVYEGCYGSSSGKSLEGFKVYIEATLFPTRFLDSEFDEIVNIEDLCNEYGTKVDLDAEAFEESMYLAGIEGKSDNTYNYMGHDSHTPHTLCDADYTLYEFEEKCILSIKFHCGGDPRGNYTSNVLYEFDSIDDFYCALIPSLELIDEEKLDEINSLKESLWKLKGEEKFKLKKQIKQLIEAV